MVGMFTSKISLVHILSEKMAVMKINSNLKKWLFQIGWIIINAIWYILCADVEMQNSDVNKTIHRSGHYSGVLFDVCRSYPKNFTLLLAHNSS